MPGFRIREGEKWYGPYEADPLLRRHAKGTLGTDVVFEDIDSGAILTLDQFLDRAKQQRAQGSRKPVAAPRKRGPGALQSKPLQRKVNYPFLFGCICLMACFFPPWFSTPVGSVSGYQIPYYIPRALTLIDHLGWLTLASNSLWSLAFIGVFAFYGLGDELASLRKMRNRWWLRLLTAMSPLIAIAIIIGFLAWAISYYPVDPGLTLDEPDSSEKPFSTLTVLLALLPFTSWGLWLMAAGMAATFSSIFTQPEFPPKPIPALSA